MMTAELLPSQLAAIDWLGSGKRARQALESDGPAVFEAAWRRIDGEHRDRGLATASELLEAGVELVTIFDEDYPARLRDLPSPPPFLFARGRRELLAKPGVGVCGSRNASERGLAAAGICADRAVGKELSVISGYARGVDTEAHLAALEAGGETVIVLPEGIAGFRVKRALENRFSWDRVLVLSQFAPRQVWSAGNAMTRNGTIVGLASAVLVVEAGATGGTLNAGRAGLAIRRRVAAAGFGDEVSPGSAALASEGAVVVRSVSEFERFLDSEAGEDLVGQAALFRSAEFS